LDLYDLGILASVCNSSNPLKCASYFKGSLVLAVYILFIDVFLGIIGFVNGLGAFDFFGGLKTQESIFLEL
jgi:hypothetical protein